MNILMKIGEGVRDMIRVYVEIKGVGGMEKELRQTNIIGFYGRKGRGIEVPNTVRNKNKTKKKKGKKRSTVQLRKGGYEIAGGQGGTIYWDFKAG